MQTISNGCVLIYLSNFPSPSLPIHNMIQTTYLHASNSSFIQTQTISHPKSKLFLSTNKYLINNQPILSNADNDKFNSYRCKLTRAKAERTNPTTALCISMENASGKPEVADLSQRITIKGILSLIMSHLDDDDYTKKLISLGIGDPTAYSCFTTTPAAELAVADSLSSSLYNGYAPTAGLPQAREAIADYLSRDLPYRLAADDVFVTSGCTQAIDIALSTLSRPGANILLPRPGFPIYELCSWFRNLEARHFDLVPDKGWEIDLDAVESLADENTVAIVVINPGNPCGNVYSYNHLKKIAETAKKLGIVVVADEVYGHLAFGCNPFVPMGVFGSIAPVLTLGSLSKRWIVPGWRLGWFVMTDPSSTFKNPKIVERLKKNFDICGGPATFIQAAVPRILEQTDKAFFRKTLNLLKQSSEMCFEMIKEIPCLTCPHRPQGSMAVMVRLNLSELSDITDDIDFCFKLAKEELVILLPGIAVGLKNWVRITFAVDPASLEEALRRVKSFSMRHASDVNYQSSECIA